MAVTRAQPSILSIVPSIFCSSNPKHNSSYRSNFFFKYSFYKIDAVYDFLQNKVNEIMKLF